MSDGPGGKDIPGKGHNMTTCTKARMRGIGEEFLTSLVVEARLGVRECGETGLARRARVRLTSVHYIWWQQGVTGVLKAEECHDQMYSLW